MESRETTPRMQKDFPVFDCDAHVQDPNEIWDFVEPGDEELVRRSYWKDDYKALLNGRTQVLGSCEHEFDRGGVYHPGSIAGPEMNVRIMRKLLMMAPLSQEQMDYLNHQGSYHPEARLRDMDLMGIDQVLIVPTMIVAHAAYIEDANGARAFCRAYNGWLQDFCSANPDRLFGAAMLPVQSSFYASEEVLRIAEMGFPVALLRPYDARGRYPNRIFDNTDSMDRVFAALQDTGTVLGMHTFPLFGEEPRTSMDAPGELILGAGAGGRPVDTQSTSFIFEAMAWLSQVLLSGFLDHYPRLRMAIFESNASWLPLVLERCDRLFKLYRNERRYPAVRLPSEAFFEQCIISFEGDETDVARRWDFFENIGVWASDSYHHDGSDSWDAIRRMRAHEVPAEVQAKLMGANAAVAYGIEPVVFVNKQPPPIERPDWFPREDAEFQQWWDEQAHPRRYGRVRSDDRLDKVTQIMSPELRRVRE